MVEAAPRRRLDGVQAMRGAAALLVVLHHTTLIMAHPEYGGLDAFRTLTGPAWTGVNFFFVLSGFIILHAHHGDIGVPRRLAHYAWRRIVRVYPLYWLCLTGFVGAALAGFGKHDFATDPQNLLTDYLLVHIAPVPSLPLKVAWTLIYEIAFYAAFAILIASRRLGILLFAAWAVAIAVDALSAGPHEMGVTASWSAHFFLGMAVYALSRRLGSRAGLPLLLAGLVTLAVIWGLGVIPIVAGDGQQQPGVNLLVGTCYAAILLGGVLADRGGGRWPRAALLLGDASYADYLVHSAIISAACMANHRLLPGKLPAPLLFVLIALVAVSGGILVHLAIEKPLLAILRRVRLPGTARAAPAHAGVADLGA